MSTYRLPPVPGEWVDRNTPIAFRFENEDFQGLRGDTITSALWACGIRTIGRSFKYHRPRGTLSLAGSDINGMMQWGKRSNVRSDVTPLERYMDLRAANTWGGLDRDRAKILDHLSAFLPVGFYYKAFYGKRLFPRWEKMFRAITGIGCVDVSAPRRHTAKDYDFCSVAVVGAGPSGLSAAWAAAEQGADVLLIEESMRAGGSGHYQRAGSDAGWHHTEALFKKVLAHERIRFRPDTYVAGYYADHWLALVSQDKMTKLRPKTVIFATGAMEQPAVFRNNDLPGVMLGSAAQRLMHRFAVKPMHKAVILCANDNGYEVALDLMRHGVDVAAVADMRSGGKSANRVRVEQSGVAVSEQCCIYEAIASKRGDRVRGVRVAPFVDGVVSQKAMREIACDGVIMSVGWAPTANLLYQAQADMEFSTAISQFVPKALPSHVYACGRLNGVYEQSAKMEDGERAGAQAALAAGFGVPTISEPAKQGPCASFSWPIVPHPLGKNFVDFDEDLQLKDFENAVQEGFDNVELLKRFTTNGMGPSQGKHSNMNALRILARLKGQQPGDVGSTTARPFFHPVPLDILAGRGFHPERRTPIYERHRTLGAAFMRAGDWLRPEYYEHGGCDRQGAVQREVAAVRNGVGVIDVGTLGKLDVVGPQAADLLERCYLSHYRNLKVGMTRYAVMCDEAGVLVDDGVVGRLAEDHFYFTTTTAGAAQIYREMTRLNAMWQLDCGIINYTGAFAAVNLAGPRSREVLAGLTDVDLSTSAFPYLAIREGQVAGIPARLMRVGFVGEWGYEIHVPAAWGMSLWDAIIKAGRNFNIQPFGVEAQRILRLEKGHLIIGQDTDALTNPFEAGLSWAVKLDKPFFIGKRSLQILAKKPLTQKLVGFQLHEADSAEPPQESHLIIHEAEIAGRITSVAYSKACGAYVGLAMVRTALSFPGTLLSIRLTNGCMATARVVVTPFYDAGQMRQKETA